MGKEYNRNTTSKRSQHTRNASDSSGKRLLYSSKIISSIDNHCKDNYGELLKALILFTAKKANIFDSFIPKLCLSVTYDESFRKLPKLDKLPKLKELKEITEKINGQPSGNAELKRNNLIQPADFRDLFYDRFLNGKKAGPVVRANPGTGKITLNDEDGLLVSPDYQALTKVLCYMKFYAAGDYFDEAFSPEPGFTNNDNDHRSFKDVYLECTASSGESDDDLYRTSDRMNSLILEAIGLRNTIHHSSAGKAETREDTPIAEYEKKLRATSDLIDYLTRTEELRVCEKKYKVKEGIERFIHQLSHPYQADIILSRYQSVHPNDRITEATVREVVLNSKDSDMMYDQYYIYDMDRFIDELHIYNKGSQTIKGEEKTREYLLNLNAYSGGYMQERHLLSFARSHTLVLSRDYVMSEQFSRVMFLYIKDFVRSERVQVLIPTVVSIEIKNGIEDDSLDRERREQLRSIERCLADLQQKGLLHCKNMTGGSIYSEQAVIQYLDLYQSQRYCVLTLDPEAFVGAESDDCHHIVYGKFAVSGSFMLYQRFIERLRVTANPDQIGTCFTDDGERIILESEIESGGEGVVRRVNLDGKVAKIFNPARIGDKEEKLKAMITAPVMDPHICWPEKLLYDDKKRFVGYLMPHAAEFNLGSTVMQMNTVNPSHAEQKNWTRIQLAEICLNIAKLESSLLSCGEKLFAKEAKDGTGHQMLVGDVSDKNITVDLKTREVYFIDCDSYVFGKYRSTVKTPAYMTPSFGNMGGESAYRKELYAFALMFFRILMNPVKYPVLSHNGQFDRDAIEQGRFVYDCAGYDSYKDNKSAMGAVDDVIWYNMPDKLKKLFAGVFVKHERVVPSRWVEAFEDYIEGMKKGDYNKWINPKKYMNTELELKSFNCRFCAKKGITRQTNLPINVYKSLTSARRILYCPDCARIENQLYSERNRMKKQVKCANCGKPEQIGVYDAARVYFENTDYICPVCKKKS